MKTPGFIPTGNEFAREAIIVMGGALIAALIFSQLPAVRKFVQDNLGGAGGLGNAGCDCDKPH